MLSEISPMGKDKYPHVDSKEQNKRTDEIETDS